MPPEDPLAASRSSRFRVGLGAAIVLVLVGIGVTVLVAALGSGSGHRELLDAPMPSVGPGSAGTGVGTGNPGTSNSGAEIYVHVLGAVNRPGLYVFHEGDRAIDAVAAAGGYAETADRRALNLARFLFDGEQIIVPTQAETASGAAPSLSNPGANGGKINLNTADAAALETLPRVGPAMASRIIAWREENGRFASVEDLMSVSGIGEKTFAALKDLVTV